MEIQFRVSHIDFSFLSLFTFTSLVHWGCLAIYHCRGWNRRSSTRVWNELSNFPFQLCVSGTFEESEHLKKPFKVTSSIVFGTPESSSKKCPIDKSKIELNLTIGSPSNALEKYDNLTVSDEEKCTKDIVKFSPVSLTAECKQSQFDEILAITDFKLKINFERVRFGLKFFENIFHKFLFFRCQKVFTILHHVLIIFSLLSFLDELKD